MEELKNYKLVHQSSDQLDEMALVKLLGEDAPQSMVRYVVDSSMSVYQLARTSKVVVPLPNYTSALTDTLVHVPIDQARNRIEIWLSYQKDVTDFEPASAFLKWVEGCFDKKKFPWFGEDFISPQMIQSFDRTPWEEALSTFSA